MASEQNKPEECEACGFTTEALKHYGPSLGGVCKEGKWLCDLCAGTFSGSAIDHPSSYRGQTEILQTICYVGNAVLAALKVEEQADAD